MDVFWKDKQILAYIALPHHTRFITPVMETLSKSGANIHYIVGQAERSQETTAIQLGLDYDHIYDFITDTDHDQIRQHYSLLKQTVATALKKDFLLGTLPVTVTDKTLHATAMEYVGIRNLLAQKKPDLCFCLHELNRWGKMFAFWAKKKQIPFFTLQEGLTYNLDFGYSGHAQYATQNLVWGERVKQKMVSFDAPESKIIPVGNTHLAKEIAFQETQQIRKKKRASYGISHCFVSLLLLSSTLPDPDLLAPVFTAVSDTDSQALFVKFHPASKKPQLDQWRSAVKTLFNRHIHFIHAQESTYDLISMADVCVLAQPSTTGLEAIAFGKPLVKLDFAYTPNAPYSFVDQKVAVKMRAQEFADALTDGLDFSCLISEAQKQAFLMREIIDTTGAIETVCRIFKQSIQAATTPLTALKPPCCAPDKKWSIFVTVPDHPDAFLAQLEAIAFNSRSQGDYEIILLEPHQMSDDIRRIADSLTGDIQRILVRENHHWISTLNTAAASARGERLIFLEKNLAPLEGWLACLNKAFSTHGNKKAFGGRICDTSGRIIGSGMVVDRNNAPVPAYHHLFVEFPPACKERSFQMVDLMLAVEKDLFVQAGGFTPSAGPYWLMDLCLKIHCKTDDPDAIVYLPDLRMIQLAVPFQSTDRDSAVYFYSRWHSRLWTSEDALYRSDGISPQNLSHARLAAAMQSAGQTVIPNA